MSTLMRCYPADRGLDFLLVVILGVALASSTAWLIAPRLAGKAALRHHVLFSALICCLAFPALALFCAATGLTLVSFPILRGEQERMPSGVTQIDTDLAGMPPRQSTDPPPAAAELPLPNASTSPHSNTTMDPSRALPAANQIPALSTPSQSDVPHTGSPAATLVSFRGIATGALFVWAAGALLMLVRLARSCGRVVLLRRSARALQNECRQVLLQEIATKVGMRQVPLLLVSSRTVTPLAVGIGRPAVILPEHLLGAVSDNELRDVLMHEVAHLERGDQRIVLLQELAAALYWPIVSIHALNRELQRAREELCDNVVLAGRDAISYGETLLHIAELSVNARPMRAAVGIVGGQGELERRVAGLIDPRRNTMTTTSRRAACIVMFMFIAWGAIASATRFAASASAAQAASSIQKSRDPDDPKSAGHFSGRVTGPDGKPLSGARVFVPLNGANKEAGPVRAKTDADGRFEFDAADMTYTAVDGLPARRQGLVIVTADGYAPDWFPTWGHTTGSGLRTHWDPVKGDALNLQLAKDDVPIRGRLLDPAGRPLAGARVRLTRLQIPRRGDLDAHLDLVTKDFSISLSLDYERELYHPHLVPGLTTETRTDADGRFTISGLGRDRLAGLTVSAPSVVDTYLTVMTRAAPDVGVFPVNGKATEVIFGAGFTLKLKQGRTISGVVRDRDSRKPIAGMLVGIGSEGYPRDGIFYNQTVTDADGRFKITGLDPATAKQPITAMSAPGLPYLSAGVLVEGDAPVLIECQRAIPFRLKVVDEQARPVEAVVTYYDVAPNPHAPRGSCDPCNTPLSRAARKADGMYHGFVVPGPGAVLVETPGRSDYRPAQVDPKAFFAPGRTEWTAQEWISTYGTKDSLSTSGGMVYQHEYAAIVLVNPAADSGPLDLSATVVKNKSRRVSLIDPDGKPVVGAQTQIAQGILQPQRMTLRASSLLLTGLHPDRVRRITFLKEERQLVGFLPAQGDGDMPSTVRMEPWSAITGRIVDENGKALPIRTPESNGKEPPTLSLYIHGNIRGLPDAGDVTDAGGRFLIGRLVPGQRYSASIYQDQMSKFTDPKIENLVLRPGEVRDLGDIRIKASVNAKSDTKPGK